MTEWCRPLPLCRNSLCKKVRRGGVVRTVRTPEGARLEEGQVCVCVCTHAHVCLCVCMRISLFQPKFLMFLSFPSVCFTFPTYLHMEHQTVTSWQFALNPPMVYLEPAQKQFPCILEVYYGSCISVLFLVVCYNMCMCIWFVTSILCCICPELALLYVQCCVYIMSCIYLVSMLLYFCNVLHMIISLPWMLHARTHAICLICSVQHVCLGHVIYICTEWWVLHSCSIQCIYTAFAFFL